MEHDALWLVAINTLLHEIGVPLPLTPTVLMAGAGAMSGGAHPLAVVVIVIFATLLGNSLWFAAGRRYGSTTLKFLCRLSLSADSCATRTEQSFGRWGGSSIVVGRFIPGASLLATPLAGALGMSWSRFIALSTVGTGLWALTVVGAGMLLHQELDAAIRVLDAFTQEAIATIVALVAMFISWIWWRRTRVARKREVRGISVDMGNAPTEQVEAPLVDHASAPVERRRSSNDASPRRRKEDSFRALSHA